jgi:hypothetical protein
MRTWFWMSSPTERMRTVGEVVLVVEAVARLGVDEVQQVGGGREDLGRREHRLVELGALELDAEDLLDLVELGAELAVELVATDPAEVVAAVLEERVAEVGLGRLDRRRLARAGPLVDLDQRLVLGGAPARGPSPTGPSRKSKWLTNFWRNPGWFSSS